MLEPWNDRVLRLYLILVILQAYICLNVHCVFWKHSFIYVEVSISMKALLASNELLAFWFFKHIWSSLETLYSQPNKFHYFNFFYENQKKNQWLYKNEIYKKIVN